MIQLSLTQGLAFYSFLLLAGAVVIWLYTEITARRVHHRLEAQYLWRCIYCAYTYLDENAETLSQCPRCGSFNSLTDKHARFIKAPRATLKPAQQPAATDDESPRRNPSRRKRPGARRRGPRRRH